MNTATSPRIPAARFSHKEDGKSLEDKRRHDINSQLMHSIDLYKLKEVMDRLTLLGMKEAQANAFMAQAEALQALIRTENNRLHSY